MRKYLIVIALSLFFLISCMPPAAFEIIPTGDKFSNPDSPYGTTGSNNRLSTKSTKGGSHLDRKGVYLNPFVYKDRKTERITQIGFHIFHFSYETSDGFLPIQRVVFLTDKNERIAFDVIDYGNDFEIGSWNNVSKEYNTTFQESGMGYLTYNDFYKLSHSNYLEVKIEGQQLSQIYNKKDVLPSFTTNLRIFFDTAIGPQ